MKEPFPYERKSRCLVRENSAKRSLEPFYLLWWRGIWIEFRLHALIVAHLVMATQRIYVFHCPHCKDQIVLPRQTPLGIYGDRHYQPMDGWPLRYLCSNCGQWCERSPAKIQKVLVEALLPGPHSAALVEFQCAQENCGKRHAIYTKQRDNASEEYVVDWLFSTTLGGMICHGGEHEHAVVFPEHAMLVVNFGY